MLVALSVRLPYLTAPDPVGDLELSARRMGLLYANGLAGAGVDVTDPEPLPPGHALWKFKNVMITPHIAGRSDLDNARMLGTIKDNIRRFADGLPMVNVVDKKKGY